MTKVATLGIALAAFLLAACTAGLTEEVSMSPTLTAEPTRNAAASEEPAPEEPATVFAPSGLLEPGTRYALTPDGLSASFAVPTAHWISNGSFLLDGYGGSPDQSQMFFWTGDSPVGTYADPCAEETSPPAGTSAADLAAAVASVPGTELLSGPSDVTVDGYPGQYVELFVPKDIGCTPNSFLLWYFLDSDGAAIGRFASWPDSTIRVWIIEVEGARAFVEAETRYPGASAEVDQEFQEIVESIDFE